MRKPTRKYYFNAGKCILFLLFFNLLFTGKILSQQADSAQVKPRKVVILPLPAIGYAPETRLYFGAVVMVTLPGLQKDSVTRLSSAKAEFNYTLNQQWIAELQWNLFSGRNRHMFDGLLGYRKFPENYWGTGAATPDSNVQMIDIRRVEMDLRGMRLIKGNHYAGLRLRMQQVVRAVPLDTAFTEWPLQPGSEGGASLGAGPAYTMDSRDNPLNSRKGVYLSFNSLWFVRPGVPAGHFTRTEADLRKYLPLGKNHLLAFQAFAVLQTGSAPFRMLALAGSDRELRGYYQGRYRDQNLFAVQTEYRVHIWWRIGLTAFAGIGEVWNWKQPFSMAVPKYSLGGGLRFLMDKKDTVNLRFDFAAGNGTTGFYVGFGEAF